MDGRATVYRLVSVFRLRVYELKYTGSKDKSNDDAALLRSCCVALRIFCLSFSFSSVSQRVKAQFILRRPSGRWTTPIVSYNDRGLDKR